ncbi:uncharacterized protein LOC125855827 [Solanum stenotomum]|uniref:uncharacterized protein LOC125855827 n=1 Tax=Solanum stenotomum TaxID=172797 RepID=UPI0020D1E23B|nr:uncharacterized protein LOC125855827 [Solanum stenotomum]
MEIQVVRVINRRSDDTTCSSRIMPPRKAIRGRPARKNVDPQDQWVPNAPEVQPKESQVVANQASQQRGVRHDVADTSIIREFLRMNPLEFTSSSVTEDPKNFVEEFHKVFEVMHVADAEPVEVASYQLKGVARVWYDQWMKSRAERTLIVSWVVFEEAFLGSFFPRELREAKVEEYKLRDKEEFCNKKAKTTCNEYVQHKGNVNRSSLQQKPI